MKKSKLENIYNEINTKYNVGGNIDSSKINEDINQLNQQIENYNKEIEAKRGKLQGITNEEGRKNLQELIEKAEKGKKQAEMRKQNLQGYEKYNSQISKIQYLKTSLGKKISRMELEKGNAENSIKTYETLLKSENTILRSLLEDNTPEKTVKLTNQEYDELQEKIKKSKDKIEDIKKKLLDAKQKQAVASNKIDELKGKIGKCDLAWKTLFTNKGWDEIQRRTIEDSKRLTRKTNKTQEENKTQENVNKNVSSKTVENNEEKSLVELEKPSLFKRFTNFIKKTANNVKNFFISDEEMEERNINKKDVKKAVEEIKENISKKDKFIEDLRFNVDKEYKEKVNHDKEQAYIAKHKAKEKKETDSKEMDDR